jgi:biopolymer transport protein ExbD
MGLRRRSRFEEDDTELDMVPIMNMFLVLIPFLLMSASFMHIKAINTSVPVLASGTPETTDEKSKKSDIKVKVIVELKEKAIVLTAMSDELDYKELTRLGTKFSVKEEGYPLDKLAAYLIELKEKYPKSDTLVLVPGQDVVYETIISAMDAARSSDAHELFPNVVLSGKIG